MALTTNLVAYYKLDNVNDSVASYTLTNNNATTFSSGLIGNAASAGTLLNRQVFTAVNVVSTDSLQITIDVSVG
jgi:hypothetical protein